MNTLISLVIGTATSGSAAVMILVADQPPRSMLVVIAVWGLFLLGGLLLLAALLGLLVVLRESLVLPGIQLRNPISIITPRTSTADVEDVALDVGAAPELIEPSRVYTDITVPEIQRFYHERTKLQADILLKPYLGQWMTVTADISEVSSDSPSGPISVSLRHSADDLLPNVSASFSNESRERLSIAEAGETITFDGQIRGFSIGRLQLAYCELR